MAPSTDPRLQRFNLVGIVFLTLISTGVYQAVWFLRRRRGLNALESESRMTISEPVVMIVLVLLSLAMPMGSGLQRFCSVMYLIVGLILSFRVRSMLRDHLAQRPETLGEKRFLVDDYTPSAVLTFFLTHIYLQYKINQMVDSSEALRNRAGDVAQARLQSI